MLVNINNKIKENIAFKKIKAMFSYLFEYIYKKSFWGILQKFDEKFIKFIFVGLLNTLVSYLMYVFFIFIGLKANSALFLQYIFGVLWNFKTTGTIVFKNKNNRLIFKFIFAYIITFFINSVLLYALTKYLNDYISQAILILPVAMLSFLLMKHWVFAK